MITPAREVLYDSPESFADDLEARAKKLRGKYSAPAKEHLLSDVGKLRDGLTLQNIDKYLPVLYERRCHSAGLSSRGRAALCVRTGGSPGGTAQRQPPDDRGYEGALRGGRAV